MLTKDAVKFLAIASALSSVSARCVEPRATPSAYPVTGNETADYATIQSLAETALSTSKSLADAYSSAGNSTCTSANLRVRREWGTLDETQRLSYIQAVQCLQAASPRTPVSVAPGAKTRFDDFVATHINQTTTIHYTGKFLSWHRYFTWLYEEALRSECGFTGDFPYWDWSLTALSGLESSSIFDGSDTSLSGNGEYIANQSDVVLGGTLGLSAMYLPAGTGGGCITSGPFVNMSVNLGPAYLDLPGGLKVSNIEGSLAYNPRCLKRDLTNEINQKYANATAVLSTISDYDNVYDFQYVMQGVPNSGSIGIHGGGHYAIGGDPGRDTYVSPGDPVFYLHHGMIDRVWWLWQMQNPQERQYGETALDGTVTFLNTPASENTTFADTLDAGYAADSVITIQDAMSTVAGPFCYVYE